MGEHMNALADVLGRGGHRLLLAFPRERSWFSQARDHGAEVIELPSIENPLRSGFRAEIDRVVAERSVDLLHAHFSYALPVALAFRSPRQWLGRQPRLPMVYHWHNPPKALQAQGVRAFPGGTLQTAIARWGDRVIDRHVAVSSEIAELLVSHRWTVRTKVTHLPNGLGRKPADPVPFRAQPSPLVIGTVANFREQKDHATLLKAMALVVEDGVDVQLRLVGDGATRPEMEALAANLGIQSRVEFLGSSTDPAPILRSLDVFVLSTHFEGNPLALLEAMSHGLPIIATDVASVRDVLSSPSLGRRVPPRDPGALAGAIRELVANPDARRSLAEAAWTHSRSLLSVEDWAVRMMDLFESTAEGVHRTPTSGSSVAADVPK